MSLMIVEQVAAFLGVQNERVERLESESLLPAAGKDANGSQVFKKISRKIQSTCLTFKGLETGHNIRKGGYESFQ